MRAVDELQHPVGYDDPWLALALGALLLVALYYAAVLWWIAPRKPRSPATAATAARPAWPGSTASRTPCPPGRISRPGGPPADQRDRAGVRRRRVRRAGAHHDADRPRRSTARSGSPTWSRWSTRRSSRPMTCCPASGSAPPLDQARELVSTWYPGLDACAGRGRCRSSRWSCVVLLLWWARPPRPRRRADDAAGRPHRRPAGAAPLPLAGPPPPGHRPAPDPGLARGRGRRGAWCWPGRRSSRPSRATPATATSCCASTRPPRWTTTTCAVVQELRRIVGRPRRRPGRPGDLERRRGPGLPAHRRLRLRRRPARPRREGLHRQAGRVLRGDRRPGQGRLADRRRHRLVRQPVRPAHRRPHPRGHRLLRQRPPRQSPSTRSPRPRDYAASARSSSTGIGASVLAKPERAAARTEFADADQRHRRHPGPDRRGRRRGPARRPDRRPREGPRQRAAAPGLARRARARRSARPRRGWRCWAPVAAPAPAPEPVAGCADEPPAVADPCGTGGPASGGAGGGPRRRCCWGSATGMRPSPSRLPELDVLVAVDRTDLHVRPGRPDRLADHRGTPRPHRAG